MKVKHLTTYQVSQQEPSERLLLESEAGEENSAGGRRTSSSVGERGTRESI